MTASTAHFFERPADAERSAPASFSMKRINLPHLAIALFVCGVSVMLAMGAWMLPIDKGYSIVGTTAFPYAIALFMGTIGVGLVIQSFAGMSDEPAEVSQPEPRRRLGSRIAALGWVSIGLLADAFLIEQIGFTLAATVLFVTAARGFGSKRWLANAGIGVALTWPVYLAFTQLLGLSLPALIKPWL